MYQVLSFDNFKFFNVCRYYGSVIDLRFSNDSTNGDTSPYIPNGEWVLLGKCKVKQFG